MRCSWDALHGLKPTLIMVVVQIAFAGVNVFYKLAVNDGVSLRVLIAYRFLFATAFIAPIAFFLERKKRPKMSWKVMWQAFVCGFFGGVLAQNLYVESLALTSATFASAIGNLSPAITFLIAIPFGLERLGVETKAGKAKVLGTLMGIGGAMLLTFYKGVEIHMWSAPVDLLQNGQTQNSDVQHLHKNTGHHVLGSLLAVASCACYAFWLIIQTKMSKVYPCHYSSTALMSIMGSIQAIIVALCMEKDWNQWKLALDMKLYAAAYSGIVASGLMVALIAWCVNMRGPLFVSVFSPLILVLVAIAGSLLLDEKLYLGSVLGGILIVCGLYVVLWGKGKEMKKMNQLVPTKSSQESELLDIIVTSPEHENSGNNGSNSNSNNNGGGLIDTDTDSNISTSYIEAKDRDLSEKEIDTDHNSIPAISNIEAKYRDLPEKEEKDEGI